MVLTYSDKVTEKRRRGKKFHVSIEGYLSKKIFGNSGFQEAHLFLPCSWAMQFNVDAGALSVCA